MNNFLLPRFKLKWLFNNQFLLIEITGLLFLLLDRIIRLKLAETLLKYYLLSILYILSFIFLYLITRTSNQQGDVSNSNPSFRERLAEVKSVFDKTYILLQKNRTDLSVLVERLRDYRQTLLDKEKNISWQQIFPSHSSHYQIAWKHWRGILLCGVSSFGFLMLSLYKVYLASCFLGWIYFTCIILFLSTPILKKYRSICLVNWLYYLIKLSLLSKLILGGLLVGLFLNHLTLNELQQSYLYEAVLIGILAPVYILVGVNSFSRIDTAIQGIELGELLVATNLKEHNYYYECSINYPKIYLQSNSVAIGFLKRIITANNFLSRWLSNYLGSLFYQGDIDIFITRFLINKRLTVVFECKSTTNTIKVKNFQEPRRNSVLGRVKEGRNRRTIEPLNKGNSPEQLIQEKADWLQIERKLLNKPIPVLVFTQATLRLSEQYLVDNFYCFNGTWIISYNQLNDFLNYLERQAAVWQQ